MRCLRHALVRSHVAEVTISHIKTSSAWKYSHFSCINALTRAGFQNTNPDSCVFRSNMALKPNFSSQLGEIFLSRKSASPGSYKQTQRLGRTLSFYFSLHVMSDLFMTNKNWSNKQVGV